DLACAVVLEHTAEVVERFVDNASPIWQERFHLPKPERPAKSGQPAAAADPGGDDSADFVGQVLDAFLDCEKELGGAAISFATLALDKLLGGEPPVIERAAALAEIAPDVERRNSTLVRCLCYADPGDWSSIG